MKRPDDEVLMAYADGELREAERRRVQEYLRTDEAARQTVEMFGWTSRVVDDAMAGVDFEDTPERLTRALNKKKKTSFWAEGWLMPALPAYPMQIAAFASIAVAVLCWSILIDRPGEKLPTFALGAVEPSSGLATALDRTIDDGQVQFGSYRLTGVVKFDDKFGNLCQELDVFSEAVTGVPSAVLVACRSRHSKWDIVGALHTQPANQSAASNYVLNEVQAHEALGGILSMMGARQRTTALDTEKRTK
jgi:hypothetical protein